MQWISEAPYLRSHEITEQNLTYPCDGHLGYINVAAPVDAPTADSGLHVSKVVTVIASTAETLHALVASRDHCPCHRFSSYIA